LAGFTPDGLQVRRPHAPSKAKEAISHFSTRTKSFRVRALAGTRSSLA
jgi:hypothetical protein